MQQLAGAYTYTETMTPQEFYSEYYDAELCKTAAQIKTTYKFDASGNFTIYTTIINESAVRAEYIAVMIKAVKEECDAEGLVFDDEMKAYAEDAADQVIDSLSEPINAKYEIQGNKLVYTIDGYSIYETFTLNGNKLVLTGSSIGNEGYPVTMTKVS